MADPNFAPAHRNLGVLSDLYLGDPERALTELERYKELTGEEKPITGWIAELRQRTGKPAAPRPAPPPAEGAPAEAAPAPADAPPPQGTTEGAPAPAASTASQAAKNAPPANGAAGTPQPGGASRTQAKAGGKALDRLELDTTQITGNRELPKVLYIVPWKRADLGDLVGKPVNSLLDEVLAPVDRDVFKRENRYYRALMPEGGAAAGNGAAPASSSGPSGSASAAPPAKDER
jgi:hypothetical protein